MKKPAWLLSLLPLALLVSACSQSNAPSNSWTDAQLLDFMRGCERIEVVFRPAYLAEEVDHPAETLELTDSNEVRRLVSQVALVSKEACACEHGQAMIFWQDKTALRVSICSHCFDIHVDERIRHYKMPEPLYATFKNLAVQHNKKTSFDL
jgi:hypothetical protein